MVKVYLKSKHQCWHYVLWSTLTGRVCQNMYESKLLASLLHMVISLTWVLVNWLVGKNWLAGTEEPWEKIIVPVYCIYNVLSEGRNCQNY